VNLERLPLLYLDIDIHKVAGYADYAPARRIGALLLKCEDQGIPPPSLVVHSGRGLQAKWLLSRPVPAAALPRWKAMQQVLCSRLAEIGADAHSLDASRVLRLVGSVNSRNMAPVCVAHINRCPTMGGGLRGAGLVGYDFEVLGQALLAVDRHELERRRQYMAADFVLRDCLKAAANEDLWGGATTPATQAPRDAPGQAHSNLRPLPGTQLGWDRLGDLRRLVRLRGLEGGAPSGQRNLLVFLGAVFLAQSGVAFRLWDEVRELAREIAPTWSEHEVLSCVCSVKSRTEAALRGETLDLRGAPIDPRYRYKSQTLIDLLRIAPAEERELQTIISDTERRRRGAERAAQRRRSAGTPTLTELQSAREHKRAAAMDLRM
jgi:hypothetical protein